jgi:hypothetical protein
MTVSALLAALDAADIHITRDGDSLRVRAEPGVGLAPYVADLRQHKPALLALFALQDEIVAAATAAQSAFDRQHYDSLWERWYALQEQEAT